MTKYVTREKQLIIGLLIAFIISIVFVFLVKHDIQSMKQIDVSNIEREYPSEYAAHIDSAEYDSEGILEIFGWCIKQGKDYYPNVVCVLLDENNNYYKITTRTTNRPEATTYFNDGNNYDSAGIYSIVKLKDLDQTYVLHLLVKDEDGTQYLIYTGIKINRGDN